MQFVALFVYCIKKKKTVHVKVHYKTALSLVLESRPFWVCRDPAVLVPLVTRAALSSWGSVVESVSFECWVNDVSLPVGESTLSYPALSWLPKPTGPPTLPPAVWLPDASSEWLDSLVSASPGLETMGDMGKSSSVLLTSRYRLGVVVSLLWDELPLLGPLETLP